MYRTLLAALAMASNTVEIIIFLFISYIHCLWYKNLHAVLAMA